MARNNSFIRLEGTLDGLTFYRKNGESFVKTKNRVSKNRILNDPAYIRTRENMQEFGGAAKCGKAFRSSFASISRLVADSYISSRITGKFRGIVGSGVGLRGQRLYNVVDNVTQFIGFDFNILKPFDANFNAPSDRPVITAGRDSITWDIPDFNTDTYVNFPVGATHFKLALAAGYMSNYEWDDATKGYVPVEEAPNGVGVVTYSNAIAIGGMVGAATSLTTDLTAFAPIPATTVLFGATAIVFFQEVNGELYELAQGHSMKIAVGG
ncbi:hypothetical protein [Winogradskyella sediminis]|uniref:Uncharacterized protein n=1 Tax=Winogradskyella sediminis TaxID=1382466 RepID=A0A1H1MV10_9FLAO|nr:hypothetical protein [Winogradskyella sediminis]SDR90546.1 hypothetical protein SAMN04489797_0430 [Winogradskyella sediminis]